MRQRLGIATALIGDPEVLILDEPANGLDPAGIRWMRDLLRGYADQGGTVLLSSPPAARDRGHRRRHRRHRPAAGSSPRAPRPSCSTAAGTCVRATDHATLGRGPRPPPAITSRRAADGGPAHRRRPRRRSARSPSPPASPCAELRAADGAGLEEMFLELTADTQRDAPKEQQHEHRPIAVDQPPRSQPHAARRAPDVRADPDAPGMVAVELRKMFDTRSGFWLMASIVHRCRARHRRGHPVRPGRRAHLRQLRRRDRLPDDGHPADDRDPLGHQRVEPAQRADDLHAGPAPRPRRSLAKAARRRRWSAIVSIAGRPRDRRRSATSSAAGIAGVPTGLGHRPSPRSLYIVLGNVLGLLIGFMLGVLIRNSAGAIVGYFVYSFVLPTLSALLAGAPGLVRRPAALGGLQLRPDRAVRRRRHRPPSGPSSPSPACSGS